MRHLKSGRKLKRTSSHKKALLRNMATSLFEHKKIHTTEAKAKELRPFAEKLITKAKNALAREQNKLLPEGQTVDVHNRRQVGRFITKKAALQELFDAIAPVVENRPGGYTRIIKTGTRLGDAGRTAIIELVDWSAERDGSWKTKSKRRRKAPQKETPIAEPEVVEEETLEQSEETPEHEEAKSEEAPEQEEAKSEEAPEQEEAKSEEAPEQEEAKSEETPEQVEAKSEETPEQEEAKSEETPEQVEAKAEETPEQEEAKAEDADKKDENKS